MLSLEILLGDTDVDKKYSELNNTEIRNIDFENCPSKCVSCKEDCECMAVGKCREYLSKKLDKMK